jgi:branched-chain amino acid transport system substrate-binding protein
MKTKIISIIVVLAIIVVLVATLGGKTAQSIKIGALYPLTGGLASYGGPAFNAAKLAVEDINASGGINGAQLELVAEDHACDPKVAVSAYNKLVKTENIHILTSVACTGTVLALVPNLEKDNVVLLGTVTSGNKLTNVSPNFFRNWASDRQESKLLAERIIKNKYQSVATLNEETDYAKGLVVSLGEFLKDSAVKISSESFASGSADVRTQLAKLQALKTDVVFISVQTVTTGEMVLKQIGQLNFKPKVLFVNDNILKATSLVKDHAQLLEGAIGGDYVFEVGGKAGEFLAKYRMAYGADCPQINICLAEYDAIQMLAEGLKTKGDSFLQVRRYLTGSEYTGLSGRISFDANHDREGAEYSLFEIRGGKVEVVK